MLTAEEARRKTKGLEEELQKAINEIDEKILEQASQGKRNVKTLEYRLDLISDLKEHYEKMGFQVIACVSLTISW